MTMALLVGGQSMVYQRGPFDICDIVPPGRETYLWVLLHTHMHAYIYIYVLRMCVCFVDMHTNLQYIYIYIQMYALRYMLRLPLPFFSGSSLHSLPLSAWSG